MGLETDIPVYFNDESENFKLIKSIIKEQGFKTCREDLSDSYISSCFKTFTDGYIIVGKTASLKNYGSKSKYMLKGFTMFSYDEFSKTITGKIVCGKESYKGMGLKLLECVEEFALDHKVARWQINSLPHKKLIEYYKNFGFEQIDSIFDKGKLKVIVMLKSFEYEYEEIVKTKNDESEDEL